MYIEIRTLSQSECINNVANGRVQLMPVIAGRLGNTGVNETERCENRRGALK